MPQTDIAAPAPERPEGRLRAVRRRALAELALRAHRLADRLDRLPDEFGKAGAVDETNAAEVVREWRRCLARWAADSPEQVFAVKVGAGLLAMAVISLWILVGLAP